MSDAAPCAVETGSGTPVVDAPTNLAALLVVLMQWIRRYVVVTDAQATAIALWVAHTHAIDAADCTPYLQITSATKRAGKTRLLEVLEPIVARPWLTGRTSAAALVRKVDAQMPTLLLDESDAAFGGDKEYAEALRGILNSGYRKSGKATICVGQGGNLTFRDFRTFGPKAIAGIGDLPGTIADRAIKITLRRRTSDEPCQRWRERDGHAEAQPIYEQLAAWAGQTVEALRGARPELPVGLGDRQADVWEVLLAIADQAGGTWPEQARQTAVTLTGSVEDTDVTVELLKDLSEILQKTLETSIPTQVLIAKLTVMEDRPWGAWRHDKPITGRGLARLLSPLGIHPTSFGAVRGYRADAFCDAIARYLPLRVSTRKDSSTYRPELAIPTCHEPSRLDSSRSAKTPTASGCFDALTLTFGGGGRQRKEATVVPGFTREYEAIKQGTTETAKEPDDDARF